jgi:hypothetical protein
MKKQITNKTILKQGNKTFEPIDHMGTNITWENENDITVAQLQPILEGVPVISLDSYRSILSEKACKKQDLAGGFSGGVHERAVAGMFFRKGYNSNPNKYTQKDIEKSIELAKKGYDEFGINGFIKHGFDFTKQQILEQINSISVIEVDEQFNIISYE